MLMKSFWSINLNYDTKILIFCSASTFFCNTLYFVYHNSKLYNPDDTKTYSASQQFSQLLLLCCFGPKAVKCKEVSNCCSQGCQGSKKHSKMNRKAWLDRKSKCMAIPNTYLVIMMKSSLGFQACSNVNPKECPFK